MDILNEILARHAVRGEDTRNLLLGAAFVVGDKEGILYSGAGGRTGFEKSSPAFNADKFTWIASMTKIITTTCVMQIVERGLTSLDEDVRDRLPELNTMQVLRGFTEQNRPILEDNTKPVTLRMLLTHTTGLPADFLDPQTMRWSESVGRTAGHMDWSRAGFTTPFRFPPGDSWLYGSGVDWAGLVLEQVTGLTLGEYMQANIFDPLGMADSGFWPARLAQTVSRQAAWTLRTVSGSLEPARPLPPAQHELEAGGSGVYSTASDYVRFLHGLAHENLLVSKEMVQEMFRPQLTPRQNKTLNKHAYHPVVRNTFTPEFPTGLDLDFGIGGLLNVVDVPGKRRAGSMAWSGLVNSRWWIDKETGIVATLIVNVSPHGDAVVARLYSELESAVYGNLDALRRQRHRAVHAKI